jgi:hypothetical protein
MIKRKLFLKGGTIIGMKQPSLQDFKTKTKTRASLVSKPNHVQ